MEDNTITSNLFLYVIGPIVAIFAPAVVGYVKYKLQQKEKKDDAALEERNKRRDEIENSITELKDEVKTMKKDLNKTMSIILKCEHPECPSKKELSDYFERKANKEED